MKQTKNKTLLEQIKDTPVAVRSSTNSIDVDTALAWLKGEVRLIQIGRALHPDRKGTNVSSMAYLFLNRSLREAYRQGKIKIVE